MWAKHQTRNRAGFKHQLELVFWSLKMVQFSLGRTVRGKSNVHRKKLKLDLEICLVELRGMRQYYDRGIILVSDFLPDIVFTTSVRRV